MPNKRPGVDAGWRVMFESERPRSGTTQAGRSAAQGTIGGHE